MRADVPVPVLRIGDGQAFAALAAVDRALQGNGHALALAGTAVDAAIRAETREQRPGRFSAASQLLKCRLSTTFFREMSRPVAMASRKRQLPIVGQGEGSEGCQSSRASRQDRRNCGTSDIVGQLRK